MENDEPEVIFQPSGRRGRVARGATVMEASRSLGVGIEALCGGHQICGKCRVLVESGRFDKYGIESARENAGPWHEAEGEHISPEEKAAGYRLACAARVTGDLVIYVPEESRPGRQVVSKEARPIDIDCDPAVQIYPVTVGEASLSDPTADLERVLLALEGTHGVTGLTIDIHALRGLQQCLRQGQRTLTVSVWMDREIVRVQPGVVPAHYGLAVDVGTTTLAGYLCDLKTGAVVATASSMNPQIQFGEDVISRIDYHLNHSDGLARLNEAVIGGLNRIIEKAVAQSEAVLGSGGIRCEDIVDVSICGNTTMHHLLLGLDPEPLGAIPFAPANQAGLCTRAREMGLRVHPTARVYLLPNESGFVGGDNVGVMLVEEPHNSPDTVLIVDIGTNGELVLGNHDRRICSTCSCATGPALEGAQIEFGMRAAPGAIERVQVAADSLAVDYKVVGRDKWRSQSNPEEMMTKGICGSGIVDAVAAFLKAGIVDRTGAFVPDIQTGRLRQNEEAGMLEFVIARSEETAIGRDVTISQADIRQVQLAKAAIYTGCKLMLQRTNLERPDRIQIAGAFGNHLDPLAAMVLGMFPDCPLDRVSAIGNAAGDGCRIALLDRKKRVEADRIARSVEYVELTLMEDFQEQLIEAIHMPHMSDPFPHLAGILPADARNE